MHFFSMVFRSKMISNHICIECDGKCLKLMTILLQVRTFAPREAIIPVINLNHVTMYMPNGMICLECGDDFQESNHIRSVSKCAKCKYQSACSRAILEHISNCNGDENVDSLIPSPLGCEMFCICGYSSSEGMFSVKIKLNFKFEKCST